MIVTNRIDNAKFCFVLFSVVVSKSKLNDFLPCVVVRPIITHNQVGLIAIELSRRIISFM